VLAIIITIMVLEIRPPEGHELVDWIPVVPVVLAYLLSFTLVAIYWNNHHHLLRATEHITPSVMWANMALLFSLSLVPVTTAWLGNDGNYVRAAPLALYAAVCLLSGLSYYVLALRINQANPGDARLRAFIGSRKGAASPILYVAAIVAAFIVPPVALVLLVVSAALWFIPDRVLVEDDAES